MLIDTHCHLDFPQFDHDRDEVIMRAGQSGVSRIINIGSSVEGSEKTLQLSKKYPNLYSVVGIHPHEADNCGIKAQEQIGMLYEDKKVRAIGEIGLDYYKNYSSRDSQMRIFLYQLKLANERALPVVIHTREAEADTLTALKDSRPSAVLVHCFSSGGDFLKECLGLGFFVSFTCNITYKKADKLRELVKATPLDNLMLETDAPYLAPEGLRGRRNEPMQVRPLAEFVAKLKGVSFEEVADKTTSNAVKFFNL